MKHQTIRAEFITLRVEVGGKVTARLLPVDVTTRSIKTLRADVEDHLRDFCNEAKSAARHEIREFEIPEGEDRKQLLITPTARLVKNGDEELCSFSSFTVRSQVKNVRNGAIHYRLSDYTSDVIQATCVEVIENSNVELTFGTDGITIDCPLRHKGYGKWEVQLSPTTLNYELGQGVRIKYGHYLHNALWKVEHGGGIIDAKTKVAMVKLGLTGDAGEVTEKGKAVLTQLGETDPSSSPSLVAQFAGALLGTRAADTPVVQFAVDKDYTETSSYYRSSVHPTGKGKEWLRDNFLQVVNHPSCSYGRKVEMITYCMSKAHLAEFLVHGKEEIRKKAKARFEQLEKLEEGK